MRHEVVEILVDVHPNPRRRLLLLYHALLEHTLLGSRRALCSSARTRASKSMERLLGGRRRRRAAGPRWLTIGRTVAAASGSRPRRSRRQRLSLLFLFRHASKYRIRKLSFTHSEVRLVLPSRLLRQGISVCCLCSSASRGSWRAANARGL